MTTFKKIIFFGSAGLLLLAMLAVLLYTEKAPDPWEQRIADALRPADCKIALKEKLDAGVYQGPLFDTHFHIPSIPDAAPFGNKDYLEEKLWASTGVNITIPEFACMLKNDGTSGKVFAFFSIYPNIDWQALKVAKLTMEKFPDTFVSFISPPDDDGSPTGSSSVDAETLDKMLNTYPGLFKGYGEIGLMHKPDGAPALPPDSDKMNEIYKIIRKHNLLVYFHLGKNQQENLKRAAAANPDIKFIFHGDQLIDCATCTRDMSVIEDILKTSPNVYYGIDELYGDTFLQDPNNGSKEKLLAHFKDYEPLLQKDVKRFKKFIESYPDQVLWGTDRGVVLWSNDVEVGLAFSNYTRAFIALLDPAVQEKFAYKNAEKLIKETGLK